MADVGHPPSRSSSQTHDDEIFKSISRVFHPQNLKISGCTLKINTQQEETQSTMQLTNPWINPRKQGQKLILYF